MSNMNYVTIKLSMKKTKNRESKEGRQEVRKEGHFLNTHYEPDNMLGFLYAFTFVMLMTNTR